ncbi:glycosyltransferase family A protein [Helicobacter sp.]|uniref:glycosyltransferase family 2 protein n=1 Tax=Helicobacter sp. TaxID=218 RepID=UPI0025C32FB0|nr:glycosyltransferase family A protein [Helicobacter sp.]MBR2495411.1 glycosyltransferase family 2 protein [Helicobacter sp.]
MQAKESKEIKYSIIIPVRNCKEFVPYAIASVLEQAGDREDYEVIVSDNYSSDGSYEYVQTLTHKRVRVMRPPQVCTMSSHYEWLLAQSRGEWVSIVGSDDGVQPYFFHLSDRLIEQANKQGIRIVNGARAYYFWAGCSESYKDVQTAYIAEARFIIKDARKEFIPTLLSAEGFFAMPQIYAGSLVHKSVIATIKARQDGIFYKSASPDGFASAAIASLGEHYIHSHIPLTWIGSSPKSIGGGVNKQKAKELFALPKDSIECAKELGGDYALLGDIAVTMWMWEPMLNAKMLQDPKTQAFWRSKWASTMVLATIVKERRKYPRIQDDYELGEQQLQKLIWCTKTSKLAIYSLAFLLRFYRQDFFSRAYRKLLRTFGLLAKPIKVDSSYDSPTQNTNILESSKQTLAVYEEHFATTPITLERKYYYY